MRALLSSRRRPCGALLPVVLFLAATLAACGGATESNIVKTQGAGAGAFVMVASGGSQQLHGFQMEPTTGTLTPVPGSPFAGVAEPRTMVPAGTGAFALLSGAAGAPGAPNLMLFNIDPITGAVTPGPTTVIPGQPVGLVGDPAGSLFFLAGLGPEGPFLQTLTLGLGGFAPLASTPFLPGPVLNIGIQPGGGFLNLMVGATPGTTFGLLPLLPGGGFGPPLLADPGPAGFGPGPAVVHPNGRFAWVSTPDGIAVLAIDLATGQQTVTPGGATLGFAPATLALDPSGQFLVAAGGTNFVSVFRVDQQTGALQPVEGSPFLAGAQPVALAFDPTGRFLFVANRGTNDLTGFAFDPATGVLTPVPGSPFGVGLAPSAVMVVPRG